MNEEQPCKTPLKDLLKAIPAEPKDECDCRLSDAKEENIDIQDKGFYTKEEVDILIENMNEQAEKVFIVVETKNDIEKLREKWTKINYDKIKPKQANEMLSDFLKLCDYTNELSDCTKVSKYMGEAAAMEKENQRLRKRIFDVEGACKLALGHLEFSGRRLDIQKVLREVLDLPKNIRSGG